MKVKSIGLFVSLSLFAVVLTLSACSSKSATKEVGMGYTETAPSPDPRIGLGAGLFDAEEAIWNLKMVSTTRPSEAFIGVTNSDLAFQGNYVFQGNYNGIQVWDISNPAKPVLATEFVCPASQSDVSVYRNLMFISGEGAGGRLDCGSEGIQEAVSHDRLRGIRIFDISDIKNPVNVANVQTCRGSHTHSVLVDPADKDNIYIYVSGSAGVRPEEELPGCSGLAPAEDPNSALFRIEVIKVPLANPEKAAIVSSPRIFQDLVAPPTHGQSPGDIVAVEEARARGAFIVDSQGTAEVLSDRRVVPMLQRFASQRGNSGTPTAADSAAFREALPAIMAAQNNDDHDGPAPGPTQCHDITLYPAVGLAGGACGGYGLLLDISDPENPVRMDAVADSNFSYWHSATFNNDATKILFTDEWGGGGGPKCRIDDPKEWGANAYFDLKDGKMEFRSYYKLPAPQTSLENCVAHNGSLIPVPGRDIMVQSWYQGGISVFDWTDINNPFEIGFHDRGPSDGETMGNAGSWSVYWYNGLIVSSEIARGLDIFELTPSGFLSENEIEAAKSVKLDYLNTQGQQKFVWPASFAVARAYVDQLERDGGMSAEMISSTRYTLSDAEKASAEDRRNMLTELGMDLGKAAMGMGADKVKMLTDVLQNMAADLM